MHQKNDDNYADADLVDIQSCIAYASKVMELWELTDHACRICGGRVLARVDKSGLRIARCADCGATAEDKDHRIRAIHGVCACGAKQRSGKDAGHRCVRNPHIRPEMPMAIVIATNNQGI